MGVRRVNARAYVHATEDRERVLKALITVFPGDIIDRLEIREERYEGHYGNPIIVLEADSRDPLVAEKTLRHVLSSLPSSDRRYLLASLEERVDRSGSLYLRLSKQKAYLGELVIHEGDDVIRLMVSFEGSRKSALEEYRSLIEG